MVQKKLNLNVHEFIASGFCSGYVKFAPGSAGTLIAIPLSLFFNYFFNPVIYFFIIIFLIIYGSFICYEIQDFYNEDDPSWIVIDEIVGFFIATFTIKISFWSYFFAYIIFRLFDIFKPLYIKTIEEKLNCGFDIMLDDCVAGVYTLIILKIIF